MVSMKDIAEACGVSVATVSKALNNQEDIGEATKEKIKATAKQLGYFPNSAARTLKTKRSYIIGVLFVDEAQSGLTHEYFSAVLEGFKVEAESRGYDIIFINTHVGGRHMTYLEHCMYREMDGVVIACINFGNPEVLELLESDIPTVTVDYVSNGSTAVLSDNKSGIRELVEYVYSKGHRKIAYVHGQLQSAVTKERMASFYSTCEELGIEVPDEYVLCADYLDSAQTQICTEQLLDNKNRPTCILFPDDFALLGGRNAIRERGLRIPEDISIVGYDGNKMSGILNPKLTTIKQNPNEIGKLAAVKLVQTIEKPKSTFTERIIVKGELVEGESVGDMVH